MFDQVTDLTFTRLALSAWRSLWSRSLTPIQTGARQLRAGLREKLMLAFLLVVIIAVGSLALVTIYLINSRMEQNARASLTHVLTMARAEYRGRGRQIQFGMRQVVAAPLVQDAIARGDRETLLGLMAAWKTEIPEASLWLISDPAGQVLARLNPEVAAGSVSFNGLIAKAVTGQESVISTEIIRYQTMRGETAEGAGERMALMVATPVLRNEAVIGVIITGELIGADSPGPHTLRDQRRDLSAMGAPPQEYGPIIFIVQGDTIVSTCYHAADSTILGTRLSDQVLQGILMGQPYPGSATIGGQRYLILGEPLRDNAERVIGGLMVGLPARGFSALRSDTIKSMLVIFLLVAAASLLIAASLADVITQPVRELTREAKAITDGNLVVEVSAQGQDEIGELGRAFNEMAAQLRESYDALSREQRKALAAIEASVDGIWVDYIMDDACRIAMVNSTLEEMTGRRREDLVGRQCKYLLGVCTTRGDSICDTACPFLRPREVASGLVEGFIPTLHGEKIPIEIGYGRILDDRNRLVGVVHVVRDLSQRKEVERLKDEFISMVSHELLAPLNHIKGFANTLLETDVTWDTRAQRDFLGSIDREADRLTKLVVNLLEMSRIEAGELEAIQRHWHQASALLEGALDSVRQQVQDHNLEVRMPDDLPPIMADGQGIELVLANLIENAAKYSRPGTQIRLEVEPGDGEVVFSVIDQGVGIAEEQLERVFERFYRVDSSSVGGAGLGLAICKRIVGAHGGRIWVESKPGIGSRFCFALPTDGPGQPRMRRMAAKGVEP